MKTISEIAGSITLRYGRDEFEGDELDMVRAAVTAALEEDRRNLIQIIEDEKEPVSVHSSDSVPVYFNAGLYWAQKLIREAD